MGLFRVKGIFSSGTRLPLWYYCLSYFRFCLVSSDFVHLDQLRKESGIMKGLSSEKLYQTSN